MSYVMIASDVITGTFKSVKTVEEVKQVLEANSSLFAKTEYEDEYEGRRGSNVWGWLVDVADERPDENLYLDQEMWEDQINKKSTFYDSWADTRHRVEVNSHYIKWPFAGGKTRNLIVAEITKLYTIAYMLGFAEEYQKISELTQNCIKRFVERVKEENNRF